MKIRVFKIFAIGTLLFFASCSNPLDRPYNEDTLMEDLEVIVARDKAYKPDMINLSEYLFKCKINGDSINGKTYGQLIKEANEYAKIKQETTK
jgi:hypothetical protein